MDYEKEYQAAFDKATEIYESPAATIVTRTFLEQIFPKLHELDDERIRKVIIQFLDDVANGRPRSNPSATMCMDWIAWLEKQKEPKEELFVRINGLINEYIKAGANEAEQEHRLKCYHLFLDSLEDAEYFEQKEQKPLTTEETELNSIAFLEQLGYTCIPSEAKPAECINIEKLAEHIKAEFESFRNLLKKKGIDYQPAEIYWIYFARLFISSTKKLHQPAEWSGDDEANLDYLIDFCNSYCNGNTPTLTESTARTFSNWLYRVKSGEISLPKLRLDEKGETAIHLACEFIRHHSRRGDSIGGIDCPELINRLKSLRPQPKEEWSEEDKEMKESIIDYLNSKQVYAHSRANMIVWLKSLRPQPHWKPSEEQESVAERFAKIVRGNLTGISKEVQKQFEQLYFEITNEKMYGGYND